MTSVVAIVEGDGEVVSVPVLLRRLHEQTDPLGDLTVHTPIRVRRDRFLNREDEFRRHLLLAANKCGSQGWILILLDADDDCPVKLSSSISARARTHVPHREVSVVLANREYEAWFIASARALDGKRGFTCPGQTPADSDAIRNAKGWLATHMGGKGYHPVIEQPAFTAKMDLQLAEASSRSFRKLIAEWRKHMLR